MRTSVYGLLPGTEDRLYLHSFSACTESLETSRNGIKFNLHAPGNGFDMNVDGANSALTGAVCIEPRKLVAGQQGRLHRRRHGFAGNLPRCRQARGVFLNLDRAGQVIARVGGAVVGLEQ